jgi:hypothetical protein
MKGRCQPTISEFVTHFHQKLFQGGRDVFIVFSMHVASYSTHSADSRLKIHREDLRFQRVVSRARAGLPITVITIGGSVAAGTDAGGLEASSSNRFVFWLRLRFPNTNITHTNLARGSSNSIWVSPYSLTETLMFDRQERHCCGCLLDF